jgi:hypothetical protein
MIPGGMGLVVQTERPNAEHAKRLSSVLIQALMTLSAGPGDDGALAAIIADEEEQERRRRRQQED